MAETGRRPGALGAALLAFRPPVGERWLVLFAVGAAVPLVLTPFAPGLWTAVALAAFGLAGLVLACAGLGYLRAGAPGGAAPGAAG